MADAERGSGRPLWQINAKCTRFDPRLGITRRAMHSPCSRASLGRKTQNWISRRPANKSCALRARCSTWQLTCFCTPTSEWRSTRVSAQDMCAIEKVCARAIKGISARRSTRLHQATFITRVMPFQLLRMCARIIIRLFVFGSVDVFFLGALTRVCLFNFAKLRALAGRACGKNADEGGAIISPARVELMSVKCVVSFGPLCS
jgi:hypothetical protein